MPEVPSKICKDRRDSYLYDGSFACNLKDLPLSDGAVAEADVDYFGVFGKFDVIKDNEGAVDFDYGSVIDSGSDVIIPGDGLQIGIK